MASYLVWEGPSEIDGSPIGLVMVVSSSNTKTGDVVQTYIVPKGFLAKESIHSGADYAVCGDCPRRGSGGKGRTCYVSLATGLNVIARAYCAGSIPVINGHKARCLATGRVLRLGTYGDPSAIPARVWRGLCASAASVVGYTHQWRRGFAAHLKQWCMASCETEAQAAMAHTQGWRTFRAGPIGSRPVAGEITCPASAEGGHRVDCAQCRLCGGAGVSAKSIHIVEHHTSANAAKKRLSVIR